ncbi:MAG: hypothetical protein EHM42_01210 [Planctomycetaceae bacterium]|nr:MAG: hypothetical protein EHM42_01210 [Planctomycetaceae bacterium]
MARDMTVAQLERVLEKKRTRLEKLVTQRSKLQKKLALVEGKISTVGGVQKERVVRKRRGKGRKRLKNEKTLIQTVLDILAENKKGLTIKDLSAKILESGYKSSSANFQNTLYQCIYHNSTKLVHDPKTHLYRAK